MVKETYLDFDRAKYWISVGAILSDPIKKLFSSAGLIPEPPTSKNFQFFLFTFLKTK